ncbi:MAG TPA: hypothetical protein VH417_20360 [Vicinamibacterales bacterium]|jgi:hypothetical protein
MSRLCRRGFQLALALAVALGSFIPPAHVHEGDDHHPTVAHRHFAAHHHSQTEIGDSDERVIWLDDASLAAAPFFRVAGVLAVLVRPFDTTVRPAEWIAAPSFDAAPPHGPPKPVLVPRAPPLPA